MRRLAILAFAVCTSICASADCVNVSNSDCVSNSIISPVDNSLWIATRSRGILRLGTTGKSFVYSAAKGDFPSDSIAAVDFDDQGRLWMKDASGRIFNYSSLDGFVQRASAPEGLFAAGPEPGPVKETEEPDTIIYKPGKSVSLWMIAAVCLLLLACYIFVSHLIKRRPAKDDAEPETEPVPEPEPQLVIKAEPQQKCSDTQNVPISNVAFYNTVMSLVMENLSNPDFSVEDIAAATGLSRIHVNRKLKAECGQSPSAILKAERMKKASALIVEGVLPITEIAAQCGFSSQAYFSSAFKEYFGVSPSVYSKSQQN